MKLKYFVVLFGLIVIPAFGCSKQLKPDGFPPLYPVSVRVIQDGKPLEGAMVSLLHKDDTPQKWGIISTTNNNGQAVLVTHGKFYGVPEGDYHVVVTKEEEVIVKSSINNTVVDSYTLIEKQYVDKTTTPLQIQIEKKGKKHEDFNVGKPVHVFCGRNVI